MSYSNLAVLIPCHNEYESIAILLTELKAQLPQAQLVVIDNNSSDNTYQIVSKFTDITLLKEKQLGKGRAIKKGVAYLRDEISLIATIDGDLTYAPGDLKILFNLIERNEDITMIVGNRLKKHIGFNILNFTFNKLVAALVSSLFDSQVKDLLSGLRVWRRNQLDLQQLQTQSFEFETEITLNCIQKNKNILYTDISYRKRRFGNSKIHPLTDAVRIMALILKLYFLKRFKTLPKNQ